MQECWLKTCEKGANQSAATQEAVFMCLCFIAVQWFDKECPGFVGEDGGGWSAGLP